MSDSFSFSFEWIWRILAGYTTRKTDSLYRYKYPRQTPSSFSRAFLCAVRDTCPVYFTYLASQAGVETAHFLSVKSTTSKRVWRGYCSCLIHSVSPFLPYWMQYSFLTGNQCPQPYLSAGLSVVGGRGSPLVRWEEDEHVQDDMKMTDGGKKIERSGPANQRADSTGTGTSILYVFITLSKLKSQFMVFKHIKGTTLMSAAGSKRHTQGYVCIY